MKLEFQWLRFERNKRNRKNDGLKCKKLFRPIREHYTSVTKHRS